ncbi:MAG: endopeptidase La [Bdellovibrionia bacterium]
MEQFPSTLPVLPIRNAVLFPSISMPLVVGRGRSIQAIDRASERDNLLIVVAQKVITSGDPTPTDVYTLGTLCKIESITPTDMGSRQVVVTGISRFRIAEYIAGPDYLSARGESIAELHSSDAIRNEALFYNMKEMAREVLELLPGATEPLVQLIDRVDDAAYLGNVCAAYLNLSISQKQELLELDLVEDRLERLLKHMRKEREVLNLQKEIRDKMSERINKAQREALLREQLRTIRTELGEEGTEENTDDIEQKISALTLPEEASKQAQEELRRLKSLPSNSAEYHVIRTYLEWLIALPWSQKSESLIDLARARKILDEDHYGLETVKKRILQFLAVAKLKNNLHGPILCLVGPPGVGKTSLGHSIARALGRKFIRASLGGVRDEAEIRGHRRTYVGAMPGRIIQSMKRVGTKNPVMMLDEIDKLHSDFHGDPSAAMLEVLDPEQNSTFVDHYLDVPFDLSDVFFVATANVIETIPAPLRDRMEIIEMTGYTSFEKMHIAQQFLVPKQIQEHGLKPEWINIPAATLEKIIHSYTREAGVRELQRKIAAIMRYAAERIVEKEFQGLKDVKAEVETPEISPIDLSPDKLMAILGPERFYPEDASQTNKPGVATGLAWTPHGGDILFIEASFLPEGKGALTLTGQLGDVMKESAQIALSLARGESATYLGKKFDFGGHDLHLHVPAGAIPKDGPSAGVTMVTAIASLLLNKPITPSLAMTGEITLRGNVLPVGGIKEKVLAAHRAHIQTIIIPQRNQADLTEIPENVRNEITFIPVKSVDEVLSHALNIQAPPITQIGSAA